MNPDSFLVNWIWIKNKINEDDVGLIDDKLYRENIWKFNLHYDDTWLDLCCKEIVRSFDEAYHSLLKKGKTCLTLSETYRSRSSSQKIFEILVGFCNTAEGNSKDNHNITSCMFWLLLNNLLIDRKSLQNPLSRWNNISLLS